MINQEAFFTLLNQQPMRHSVRSFLEYLDIYTHLLLTMLSSTKIAEILAVVLTISFLLGGIVHLDWFRIIQSPITIPLSPYTEAAKLIVAYLACFLAAGAGSDYCWCRKDARWLKYTFCLIAAADTCFIAHVPEAGILIFMVVQLMLIVRHLTGCFAHEGKMALKSSKLFMAIVFLVPGSICCLCAKFFWYPRTGFDDTFVTFSVYFILKTISVFASYGAIIIGKMPKLNARLCAFGMTLFFICDHTVTGNLLLNQKSEGVAYICTSSLTWMFYGPALTLLALSGYDLSLTDDSATAGKKAK